MNDAATNIVEEIGSRWKLYPVYKDSGVEWLGEVPEHWDVKRILYICSLNPTKSELGNIPKDTEVSFLPMESIGEDKDLTLDKTKSIEDVYQGYTYFRNGDVIVAKITPCFENGKGALCQNLVSGIGFGTTELHVLRPNQQTTSKFIFYLTKSQTFRVLGAAMMQGTAGQKRIPEDFIRNFMTGLPPLSEQHAIASFLDRETTQIDTLITKKERLIELLTEKRSALISHAVTKGLDSAVPMKDSGVEWIGETPAHWKITHLKYAASHIVDCPHATPMYSADGDYHVIRTADVSPGLLNLSNTLRVNTHEYLKRIERLKPEFRDIVYSREGERYGIAAMVSENTQVCLGQRMMHFRTSDSFDPNFLMWQLNGDSTYRQAQQDITGATSPHVNVDTIRNFWLSEPPLEEQTAIVAYIDTETTKFDALITKIRTHIDNLKEYRTALISAAVTGKIDVREEVA